MPRGRKSQLPADQLEYLEGLYGEFETKQAAKGLPPFWVKVKRGWFERWPVEPGLNLPSMSVGGVMIEDAGFSEADKLAVGKAQAAMGEIIHNWYNNTSARNKRLAKGSATGQGSSGSGLKELLLNLHQKRGRKNQCVEIWQQLHSTQMEEALRAGGFYELMGFEKDGETPEERRVRMKAGRSAQMKMRRAVAQKQLDEAPEEEQAEVEMRFKAQEAKDEEGEAVGKSSGEEYEVGINKMGQMLRDVYTALEQVTGWVGATVMTGPVLSQAGKVGTQSYCFGITPAGNTFEQSFPDWDHVVMEPLGAFGRRVFSESESSTPMAGPSSVGQGGPLDDDDQHGFTRNADDDFLADFASFDWEGAAARIATDASLVLPTAPPDLSGRLLPRPAYKGAPYSPATVGGSAGSASAFLSANLLSFLPPYGSLPMPDEAAPSFQLTSLSSESPAQAELADLVSNFVYSSVPGTPTQRLHVSPVTSTSFPSTPSLGSRISPQAPGPGVRRTASVGTPSPLRFVQTASTAATPVRSGSSTMPTRSPSLATPTRSVPSHVAAPSSATAAPRATPASTPPPRIATSNLLNAQIAPLTTPASTPPLVVATSSSLNAQIAPPATPASTPPPVVGTPIRLTVSVVTPASTSVPCVPDYHCDSSACPLDNTATCGNTVGYVSWETAAHGTHRVNDAEDKPTSKSHDSNTRQLPDLASHEQCPARPDYITRARARTRRGAWAWTRTRSGGSCHRAMDRGGGGARCRRAWWGGQKGEGTPTQERRDEEAGGEPVLIYRIGNGGTMCFNREVEARKKEVEAAKQAAKEAEVNVQAVARGYWELPNPNGETPTIMMPRIRKPAHMPDGSAAPSIPIKATRAKKAATRPNPHAASEAALLARSATGSKKRRAPEEAEEPPAKKRGRPRKDTTS
ncbi:hypothetical protein C8R44DRAFT_747848 [Mycena epipterygia]|nr:hypothetical protein C8R44DRAFT_747848 [Mycena epipterygia]